MMTLVGCWKKKKKKKKRRLVDVGEFYVVRWMDPGHLDPRKRRHKEAQLDLLPRRESPSRAL